MHCICLSEYQIRRPDLCGSKERPKQCAGLETEADAAVGAFVRLMQEAPDLRRGAQGYDSSSQPSEGGQNSSLAPEMSLQAGLDQLAALRMQISQMTVPPASAVTDKSTSESIEGDIP